MAGSLLHIRWSQLHIKKEYKTDTEQTASEVDQKRILSKKKKINKEKKSQESHSQHLFFIFCFLNNLLVKVLEKNKAYDSLKYALTLSCVIHFSSAILTLNKPSFK